MTRGDRSATAVVIRACHSRENRHLLAGRPVGRFASDAGSSATTGKRDSEETGIDPRRFSVAESQRRECGPGGGEQRRVSGFRNHEDDRRDRDVAVLTVPEEAGSGAHQLQVDSEVDRGAARTRGRERVVRFVRCRTVSLRAEGWPLRRPASPGRRRRFRCRVCGRSAVSHREVVSGGPSSSRCTGPRRSRPPRRRGTCGRCGTG